MARIKNAVQAANGTQASAGQVELEESDLASGQLAKFNDFSNPVFKRAGSLASRVSSSRGLGESSISVGGAQGAILDRAIDISLADSKSLVDTANNNAGNVTSASISTAGNETSLETQRQADVAAGERLAVQIESTESEGLADRVARSADLGRQLDSAEREGAANRTTQMDINSANIASTEREGAANRTTQTNINLANIESNEGIAAAKNALEDTLTRLQVSSEEARQINDIASREGMAAAQRALDKVLSDNSIASNESIAFRDIESREGIAAARNALDLTLTNLNISATEANLIKDIAAREGMAAAQLAMDKTISDNGIAANEVAAARKDATDQLGITTSAAVAREGQASNERISAANIAAADTRAQLDRDNQRFIQGMSQDSQIRLEDLRAQHQVDRDNREEVAMAWNNVQTGIANIDPNASAASQQTQFNRLMDTFDSRMGFMQLAQGNTEATPYQPQLNGTTPANPGDPQPAGQGGATHTTGGGAGTSVGRDSANPSAQTPEDWQRKIADGIEVGGLSL